VKPIRVLLADDHALVRSGFRALIQRFSDIEVVAEAAGGWEMLELTAKHRPQIVLLDITMPGLNGLDALAELRRRAPATRVLVVSMHTGEEYVRRALRAGASGYLLKDAAVPELELAIRAVARGEIYLSPALSKLLVADFLERAGRTESANDRLTPRQRQILQLIAEGQTTKEIAAHLGLSIKTVETHRTQLMERLDVHDIAGLVRYAIRTGLVMLS
jgi:DNA-binding NarL/FixJ family response regulator